MGLMPDGPAPMEAPYAEEGPGPRIFRAEPGDLLRRLEAQQQPSSWAGRWCTGRRGCAVLGALGLLAGASLGSWLLVLHLWPAASQPVPGNLQDEEMTLNCSEASGEEALQPSLPRAVSFRINTEDFFLEVQVRARPGWLLVCHEGWSSALGVRICQSLGHLRLTHDKAVNLSDIRLNSSREFARLSPRLEGLLEEVWQPRDSCTSGQIVSLKCSGESCPGSRKVAMGGRLSLRVREPHGEAQPGLEWGSLPACPTACWAPTCRHSSAQAEPCLSLCHVPHQPLVWAGDLLASLPALAPDTHPSSSEEPQRWISSFWRLRRVGNKGPHGRQSVAFLSPVFPGP
nr:transmembrane protease serine 5 isoform X6 [Vicugna pacos]